MYIHFCIYVFTHMSICFIYIHISILHIYTYLYMYMYIHILMHIHSHFRTCIHIRVCIYMYTYSYTLFSPVPPQHLHEQWRCQFSRQIWAAWREYQDLRAVLHKPTELWLVLWRFWLSCRQGRIRPPTFATTYELVMSRIEICQGTHMAESCHTHEWVVAHVSTSHVTHTKDVTRTKKCYQKGIM